MDDTLDELLPDCIAYKLAEYAAGLDSILYMLYDTFTYASQDHSTDTHCCLHSVSPSTLFDW